METKVIFFEEFKNGNNDSSALTSGAPIVKIACFYKKTDFTTKPDVLIKI